MSQINIVKKDGTQEAFDPDKIITAVSKSAERVLYTFTDKEKKSIIRKVKTKITKLKKPVLDISDMHNIVETTLDEINEDVAKSYRNYRNYKQSFVRVLDKIFRQDQAIRYIGDRENANSDSALVSTKRSLIYGKLNKELYKLFDLNTEELQACKDGYIWIHDMNARRDSINCCLFDMRALLKGGFEMGNLWYNEPKTIDTAFDVIGDVILSAASQQYGGFTVSEIDKVLEYYAEKSFKMYYREEQHNCIKYAGRVTPALRKKAYTAADQRLKTDIRQGFQGLEYKLNSVASSRGDYPFVTFTMGLSTTRYGRMINEIALKNHKDGQGKTGKKKITLFPKYVFLYDEYFHGEGRPLERIFDAAIECSKKAMYPDYLSLSGDGYVASMYKKYGKVVSPMGCRAFLSPWFEKGGLEPLDKDDTPIFVGRFNIGAVSLNLPMIYMKAKEDKIDFYQELDYYLNIIRRLHIKTYEYLGKIKASTNPLGFTQGGFYGGNLNPDDPIEPVLKYSTASFGITALNELQQLHNKKSLVKDNSFAMEVMKYINDKINQFKKEDGYLYAIYGTPAESLAGRQVQQFRKKYGIIKNVSDKEYFSNSFHCHVTEEITPIEKQDREKEFWDLFNGGKIQYVRYTDNKNTEAMKTIVRRAMKIGFYEGVNLALSFCEHCGHSDLSVDVCPKCGSTEITRFDRVCGYLGYSKVKGNTRMNDAKQAEINERKSM